ncbi:hypothetical protein [Duganella levis]|uniref:Lipoprotein n=1 Tax=Duganella levis TaxID=2692169 RepID=A0ABW9VTB4_9BURK|nr:hypothetical protein [Duganella levis]MYN24864.1 hypothetical protein [Duganella levis]
MNKLPCMLAVAAVLVTAGCATRKPEQGRHGYVSKVYAVGEKPAKLPACLAALTPQQLAEGRFVDLKYGPMRLRKYATAYAPRAIALTEHDKVAFSPIQCDGSDFPRIQRVMED